MGNDVKVDEQTLQDEALDLALENLSDEEIFYLRTKIRAKKGATA